MDPKTIAAEAIDIAIRSESQYPCGGGPRPKPCPSGEMLRIEAQESFRKGFYIDATTKAKRSVAYSVGVMDSAYEGVRELEIKILQIKA
jgi:hypothetical protein